MNSYVEKLYERSKELLDVLTNEIDHLPREHSIEQMNTLLEQRDQLIKKIKPPYTAEEQKIGQKIIQLDQVIEQKMRAIRLLLKNEAQTIQKQKKGAQSYINPYKDVRHNDGMFLDQKK